MEILTFGSPCWRPGRRRGWRGLVAAAWIAVLLGGGAAPTAMAQSGDTITLIPDSELPRSPPRDAEEARARSAELIRKYPHDPRARLQRAIALLVSMDVPGAERELRAGLAEEKALTLVNPAIASVLRATLAKTLAVQSRRDEAIAMARPLCATEFKADVAKAGLCPELAASGRRAPGELDPARLVAVIEAARKLTELGRDKAPPHGSDPTAGPLLDTVLDVSDLTREVPLISQMSGIGQRMVSMGDVCVMYDLPAAPEAARERMRGYATELGRCMDAALGAAGAMLAMTADPPAQFRSLLASMKPNPHQMVMQIVLAVLVNIGRPEPSDDWRRARLPALDALAERASPLLTTDERHKLSESMLSVSRNARDAELRAGLVRVADRFGDK